ncbi:cell wall hydrolase [Sphingomonas sp. Mn802worker]|uniref:cell wall hydrolase n=1 Tax=Sphingomonas sp. Mn802worker TaxID=629773 RepID=UPI0012E9B9FE|nr:cell wall hydrolase [Sphingomonas sp. Mn802worker]
MARRTGPGTALVRLRQVRVSWAIVAALVILLASALAVQGMLRVVGEGLTRRGGAVISVPVPGRAQSSAGRAQAAADPVYASPAAGATGTIALPPVPLAFARLSANNGSVVAARPFSTVAATAVDRGRALECLTAAIYYEAASEPDDGQRAVAQVILNRARHPAFPATVCGVVYQGSERRSCQFSFACDGAMARVPSPSGWARAARVAAAALGGYVFAPVGLATHYHTYAVTPAWNRTLVMTDAVGAHFFHRWKGFWGTAGAFVQRYVGHEPVPGPHHMVDPMIPTPIVAASQAIVAPAPTSGVTAPIPTATPTRAPAADRKITPATDMQPRHANSGDAIAPPPSVAAPKPNLPESQVLDRWKDSGKPLR